MDDVWDTDKLRVDGDFVVAVPSHDSLLVTGSNFPMGIARLRQLARETFEKARHPVTVELLIRREDRWSCFRRGPRARTANAPGVSVSS